MLAVSGLIGFRIGLVGFPTWHICIETAQVVAGLVRYPADNPFYIYHTKLWSLVIQTCAVLLRAGLTEITLSLALSGLLGMISFQALAMVTYAISRDALVAIAAAVVVFASGATDYGSIYPVWLVGTHHSYGAIGLSTFVLAVGLIGAGSIDRAPFCSASGRRFIRRSASGWARLPSARWPGRRRHAREMRPALKYFAAGCAVTLLSAGAQFAFIYDVPSVDAAAVERAFSTFERLWDAHRRARVTSPIPASRSIARSCPHAPVADRVCARSAATGAVPGARGRDGGPRQPRRRVSHVASARQHAVTLSILMPARLLNLNIVLIGPLLIGLVAAYRHRRSAQALLVALLAGLLLTRKSLLWRWVAERGGQPWNVRLDPVLLFETAGLTIVCVALWQATRRRADRPSRRNPCRQSLAGCFVGRGRGARVVAVTGLASRGAADHLSGSHQRSLLYRGRRRPPRPDGERRVVSAPPAVYPPAGAHRLGRARHDGLRAGRGAGNGPNRHRGVRHRLLDPPREIRSSSVIPHDANRLTWSRFTGQRWRELRRTYNVSQIVTRSDYELDLPMVAEADGLRLYRIPD